MAGVVKVKAGDGLMAAQRSASRPRYPGRVPGSSISK